MSRNLIVYWADASVGTLTLNKHGDMIFRYAEAWLANPQTPAISVSLPKQPGAFSRRQTRPFFAGLLPDEAQRAAAARAVGVSEGNDFALLDALGGDVAGALTLLPQGVAPTDYKRPFEPRLLDDAALEALLEDLPRRPLLAGDEGLRLSLAGAQPKLPVVVVEGRVALPAPGQPTTHILKPPISRFEATTENEAFCLALAAAAGLPTARAEPRRAHRSSYLLIERYDRARDAEGTVVRLHQEDFCQALGIAPERKYAKEGGPAFPQSFKLVREVCARPGVDVLRLLDAAIFNVVIGNADAHGKNFSLLYGPAGLTLTPLYDLMATILYPEVSTKLAMQIAKTSTLEDMDGRTWVRFAGAVGVSIPYTLRRIAALTATIESKLGEVMDGLRSQGFDHPLVQRQQELIGTRARALRNQL